ncbi:hypothetical protein F5Y03DRAFT_396192 [Xylaria venustula]|nr:hypothetical protein F5Y03DRAFT_396192 [Xylaria venustula]
MSSFLSLPPPCDIITKDVELFASNVIGLPLRLWYKDVDWPFVPAHSHTSSLDKQFLKVAITRKMSPQRNIPTRDAVTSSQGSGEDEENCSNKATSGSSDPGSDHLELLRTRSRSSEREHDSPETRIPAQDLQTAAANDPDKTDTTPGTSTVGSNSLIGLDTLGLTLTPLPLDMLPRRKRSLGEVLGDEKPPQKDKMSDEIDHLARAQRKRTRADGAPSSSQALPIVTRDAELNSDNRENSSPERRSVRIRDASGQEGSSTSG